MSLLDGRSKAMLEGSSPSIVGSSLENSRYNRSPFHVERAIIPTWDDDLHDDKRGQHHTSTAAVANRQPRVLRYRETMESLFCLTDQSSNEHKQLCQQVVDGPLSDDAGTWRRVLELSAASISPGSPRGKDLLRLHRRALSRFAASDLTNQTSSPDILSIWITYARSQAKYGTIEEARMTFRRIQSQRLGAYDARFYLAVAEVEEHFDMAIALQALRIGIEQKAEPLEVLKSALRDLEHRQRIEPIKREDGESAIGNNNQQMMEKKSSKGGNNPVRIPPLPSLSNASHRKRKELVDVSLSKGNFHPSDVSGNERKKKAAQHVSFVSQQLTKPLHSYTDAHPTSNPPISSGASEASNTEKKERVESLSKTPRITRLGATIGNAQRVAPQHAGFIHEHDHASDARQHGNESPHPATTETTENSLQQSVPKVTKLDLSYILNWDPEAKPKPQKVTDMNQPPETSVKKLTQQRTDEEPARTGVSSCSSASTFSSSLASGSSTHGSGRQSERQDVKCESISGLAVPPNERNASSDTTAALMANVNTEFLPLVAESNVLRVNGKPYLKLNVIGSGGSCKVYRALSRDCSVVAIKRVKLEGIDRKTIDGYANEIALLRRLRGNPAIIEMHDSEVDLARKSIFLVLELGEVDLSQAIQQQAARTGNKTTGTGSALSMNFIRLTWQQMLQAVHCIHEERIIHGDLKPANFLFVRGTLKLIDFGIAKAIQSDDTTNIYRDDSIVGTLNYISPEAIQNTGSSKNGHRMKIGRASDIWSLGCILYQMVYGKTPFAELQTIPKLHAIINPDYEIQFPAGADEAAVDAMKLCLRRNPADRPPIVGSDGLLTEHWFLHTHRRSQK